MLERWFELLARSQHKHDTVFTSKVNFPIGGDRRSTEAVTAVADAFIVMLLASFQIETADETTVVQGVNFAPVNKWRGHIRAAAVLPGDVLSCGDVTSAACFNTKDRNSSAHAPLDNRTAVKLAGSIDVWARAILQSSEFAANATMAIATSKSGFNNARLPYAGHEF